ncbi:30S ribosomal protein S8 [Mycobacterium tuberculosis]|nr:30S ribosomal protein S8 [Mycobacterium tuberculosis]
MTMTDPIADFLTRLRNANSAYHDEVSLPHSKLKANIAQILKNEGYISDFRTEDARVGKSLVIQLKYGLAGSAASPGCGGCPSPACGCTRNPPICRGCSAAWAWRSSRPPRAC